MSAPTTSPPVDELRIGAVKAAFWENETDGGVYHTVTFSRLYRTEDGDWRSTSSFRGHDLLLLAKVADAAHTRLLALRTSGEDGEDK